MVAMRLLLCAMALVVVPLVGIATRDQAPDLAALLADVRETVKREYSRPPRFMYVEQSRDVDISRFGGVSIGPLQTFEVYPTRSGNRWKRLIAVDGKPLDPAELATNDAKHRRDVERQQAETPRQRALRQRRDAEEDRERDAIMADAYAVFEPAFAGRETVSGQPTIVVTLTPRADAQVTTREGGWLKATTGKMWISESDHAIARLRLYTSDHLSIGWGVVARLDPGSGFDFTRTRLGDAWLPSELIVEGSGRTLLFRRFEVKTVTTYSRHQPYTPTID
jgi:hypothetical protein